MRTLLHLNPLRIRSANRPAILEAALLTGYLTWLLVVIHQFAAMRPLWYDELFTLHLARVASPRELLGHLAAGVDLNPPLLYLLTRASIVIFGEATWAVRLPALLGMLLGLMCLYAFLRRQGVAVAMLAMAASVASVKVWVYFLEARPYGLVFGFAGLALLCWQRAGECEHRGRWLTGLALAAILGVSSHYYFVVVLAALGVAEIVRLITLRRRDWKPMGALALGGVTLLAWYPLWSVAPRDYAAGFWAKVTFSKASIQDTLVQFVEPSLAIPALFSVLIAFLLARRVPTNTPLPLHHIIALVALGLTPVLGVLLGATLTGGFYFRYVLPAALAFGALFALSLQRISGGAALPLILSLATFAGFGIPNIHKPFKGFFRHEANTVTQQQTILEQHAAGFIVIVETGFEFGRLWHAGAGSFKPVFLADAELARKYTQTDTTERAIEKLKRVTDVPAMTPVEIEQKLQAGESVYYFGPANAWGYQDLISRGIRFEQIFESAPNKLFRLTAER